MYPNEPYTTCWSQLDLPTGNDTSTDEAVEHLLQPVQKRLASSGRFADATRVSGGIPHIDGEAVIAGIPEYKENGTYQAGVAVGPDPSRAGVTMVAWRAGTKQETDEIQGARTEFFDLVRSTFQENFGPQ